MHARVIEYGNVSEMTTQPKVLTCLRVCQCQVPHMCGDDSGWVWLLACWAAKCGSYADWGLTPGMRNASGIWSVFIMHSLSAGNRTSGFCIAACIASCEKYLVSWAIPRLP
jgi:hypothetical protein